VGNNALPNKDEAGNKTAVRLLEIKHHSCGGFWLYKPNPKYSNWAVHRGINSFRSSSYSHS